METCASRSGKTLAFLLPAVHLAEQARESGAAPKKGPPQATARSAAGDVRVTCTPNHTLAHPTICSGNALCP